jgi:hypothetical protein
MRYWVLVFLLLLVACKEVPLEDGPGRTVVPVQPSNRPDIPRVNPPEDTPDNPVPDIPRPRVVYVPNGTPGTSLDVPMGEVIGEHHPVITQAEFPLLKHPVIRIHDNRVIGYDERITFSFGKNSTGRVVFAEDEDTEEIGSFLHFEDKKPIFEYRIRLNSGTFEDIQGREIQVLGHTYVIAEANNRSVTLYGRSVANNLIFDDGKKLFVNRSSRTGTLCNVTPGSIAFEVFANEGDDGITLSPGESLGDNIGWERFGSDLFDLRYKGAPVLEANRIDLDRTDFGYRMKIDTHSGKVIIPLVERDGNRLVMGSVEEGLHVANCGYCIAPGDNIILTAPDGRTFIMQYRTTTDDHVIFRDESDNRYNYKYDKRSLRTDLIIDNVLFPVRILNTSEHNISIDQGLRSEIVLGEGAILRIGALTSTTLPLEIVIPANIATDRIEHRTPFNITYNGTWMVIVGNTTFVDDDEDSLGQSPYGVLFHLKRDDANITASNIGEEATIFVPRERAYGIVMLED